MNPPSNAANFKPIVSATKWLSLNIRKALKAKMLSISLKRLICGLLIYNWLNAKIESFEQNLSKHIYIQLDITNKAKIFIASFLCGNSSNIALNINTAKEAANSNISTGA